MFWKFDLLCLVFYSFIYERDSYIVVFRFSFIQCSYLLNIIEQYNQYKQLWLFNLFYFIKHMIERIWYADRKKNMFLFLFSFWVPEINYLYFPSLKFKCIKRPIFYLEYLGDDNFGTTVLKINFIWKQSFNQ